MSDIGLTQEQIDSMLGSVGPASPSDRLQALADFETQTMSNLPSVLNAMTGFEFKLSNVECAPTQAQEIPTLLGDDLIFGLPLKLGEGATHYLVIDRLLAKQVAAALTGSEAEADAELSEMELSAVIEVVSQANGTYLTNLSRALGTSISGESVSVVSAPQLQESMDEAAVIASLFLEQSAGETAVVRHVLTGSLTGLIFERIDESSAPPPNPTVTASAAAAAPQAPPAPPIPHSGSVVSAAAPVQYSPAAFSQLSASAASVEVRNLDILLDVPLQVTVELGKTAIPIKQILEYGQGSLITLDKLAGEPIDLLVNGKYFAKGEVVVIEENFGVRITSILSAADRLAQLG